MTDKTNIVPIEGGKKDDMSIEERLIKHVDNLQVRDLSEDFIIESCAQIVQYELGRQPLQFIPVPEY